MNTITVYSHVRDTKYTITLNLWIPIGEELQAFERMSFEGYTRTVIVGSKVQHEYILGK